MMSEQLARVAKTLRAIGDWTKASTVASTTSLPKRTVQHHLQHLVKLGVVEVFEVVPAYRYRWRHTMGDAASAFVGELDTSIDALGLAEPVAKEKKR